jgi:DNA polymerase I-like protein with 3'-5' exonuclease and polymerase domains
MIITSSHPDFEKGSKQQLLHRYNGLDCCITIEVFEKMQPLLDNQTTSTYQFELSQLPCSLAMTFRGMLVDTAERDAQLLILHKNKQKVENQLDQLAKARWSKPLNHNSPKQLKDFFYDCLALPTHYRYDSKKKERVATCNREALEKLDNYWIARPFTRHILKARELDSIIEVLERGIDADGRFRAAFNPSGTDTGRWSSSENPFRTGSNGQNITGKLRKIFISDKGYRFGNGDLEQSESRFVGAYAYQATGRSAYLDACESGDLHTVVAQKLWPHITCKADAEQPFYLHFSFRDMAKRGGHGTNYLGTAATMALHLKLPTKVLEEFQEKYFSEFPEIQLWHQAVATELQSEFQLTTLFGRRRNFWGRVSDTDTLRAAVAFLPQSASVDYLSAAMLRIWKDPDLKMVELLNQSHDALAFQFPETSDEPAILARIKTHVEQPFFIRNRSITIPYELSVGWNWGKLSKENPDGLTKPSIVRTRTGQPPQNNHRLFNIPRRTGSIQNLGSPLGRWRSLGTPQLDGNVRWKNLS